MKVWKLATVSNKYLWLTFLKDESWTTCNNFNFGFERLLEKWESFDVEIIKERKRKMGDFPRLGSNMKVFSEKALEELKEFLIKDNIEILPLKYSGGKYYVVNVLNVIDCINFEKSQYEEFVEGVFDFQKYVLKSELIKSEDIFITPNEAGTVVFVSDRFREKALKSDLEGFEFLDVCECE